MRQRGNAIGAIWLLLFVACFGPPDVPERPPEVRIELGPLLDGLSTPIPGLTRYSMTYDDEIREYVLYVPAGYADASSLPMLLAFHGNGGEPATFIPQADFRDLADQENVLVVYPLGTRLAGEGTHWNPLLLSYEDNKSDADDFGFVEALIDLLSSRFNVDTSRVYATGFSNGGGFVYGLACYVSHKITAVAPVSGSMWIEMSNTCAPTHETALAIFNGTADFVRPYEGYPGYLMSVDEAVTYWVDYHALSEPPVEQRFETGGLTVERRIFKDEADGVEIARYKVVGGDHRWFDLSIEGNTLNELVWNFMKRFRKDESQPD